MSDFRLIPLSDVSEQKYTEFISICPHAMFYHSWKYLQLLKKLLPLNEKYLIAVDSSNKIAGVIPLVYKSGPLGDVYNSLPFYGSNGGVLAIDKSAFDFLVTEYNKLISENSSIVSSTLISNPLRPEDDYTGVKHNYTDYRIGQFSSIKFDENHAEQLMQMFHYKTRNMVRKAQKEGITIEMDNSAHEFLYDTHKSNIEAIGGKPKQRLFFDLFPGIYEKEKEYAIYVAKYNGETIAAMLVFLFNNTVEYYTPVIVEKFRDKQPLSLLIYEAMITYSKKGYKLWNWGGTWASQGGVYTFKKRWGTFDVNYHYYTQINNEKVLSASKDDLLHMYDNFFVINFSELKS
ncbi:MAG: peptidoglycan bridge formation glycyltransferase FemA/FemB family protein [Bacteroidetes bacterium]|nr:peptidoglycan bridge formation glycyltransferase FemA/FemB family protein [Bacteroidota bacterium]